MKCDDAAEFVSALYDGERIPRKVAEHLGECAVCRERLDTYSRMSAELRRMASLNDNGQATARRWSTDKAMRPKWWSVGRQTIRIPRFAFALMLIAIFLLSGGLVLVRARPGTHGPILWVTAKTPPDGREFGCPFSMDEHGEGGCTNYSLVGPSGQLAVNLRFLSTRGDQAELAVKTRYETQRRNTDAVNESMKSAPEAHIWLEPGTKQEISVAGLGKVEITAKFLDHRPPILYQPEEPLDPKKNEFRIVSPVLIRGKEVVFNGGGSSSIANGDADPAVMIYIPRDGRYLVSTVPFQDAIEGTVGVGQIKFRLEGQDYLLLTAMPTTRLEHVWVTHERGYHVSEHMEGVPDDREMFLTRRLKTLLADRMTHYSE